MSEATEAFDRGAGDYDARRRRMIPCYERFYEVAVDLVSLRGGPLRRVLDLGAGTGLYSELIAAAHPGVSLVLLDGAGEMLAEAATRLGAHSVEICQADLRDPLPAGPFDAIVSALAIHHLGDADKRDLFARIGAQLRPGGAFVNAEQVSAPRPWLATVYDSTWRRGCEENGATEQELREADARMAFDRCADTESQLAWMRSAGLTDVDCFFKDHRFAVLAGWRPA